jgi:hypothetical protein
MYNAAHIDAAIAKAEIIAVVLPDGTPDTPESLNDFVATGTMLMVRYPDGRVALEPVSRRVGISREAHASRVARNRQPILDPVSKEVVGYEMEVRAAAM